MILLVLIVPGQALRAGLRALLNAEPAIQVLADASSLEDLDRFPPEADILLVTESIMQSDFRGRLMEMDQESAVLILSETGSLNPSELPVRAWGILTPDATVEELVAAIQALNEGLIVGSPELIETKITLDSSDQVEPLVEVLTAREIEVLQFLAKGFSNKEIAAALFISEHTVKFHASSIYGKLGATNRAEAVRIGIRQGLVLL